MMQEHDYLKKCLELIEDRFQWGPRKDWTTYNFARLSQEVREASGINLSTRTLRRLCKNHRNYKPQTATKNALSVFLGYRDWEDFKASKSQSNGRRNGVRRKTRHTFRSLVRTGLRSVWFYLVMVLTVLLVLSIVYYPDLVLAMNKGKVEFTANYVTGTAPQRVTFFYDVSRISSSNIFINKNFYDDGEIIPVNKNRHYFTADFPLPDHYSVKIIANGERVSCIRIHVITDGWEGVINDTYAGKIDYGNTGTLSFNPDTISSYTARGANNILEYRNIREFELLGDHMTLETEIRNLPDSTFKDCLESTVQLINLHGRVGFNFVKPGCPPSLLNAEFGDVLLNGEFQDLDAFYQDFSDWRKVTIATRDKHIYVYLEDELIYSVKYRDPLDEIKGIAYRFSGMGEVNYVKLFNEEGRLVYEDQF